MRGKITLYEKNEMFDEENNIILYDEIYDYNITFYMNLEDKFVDVINDDSFLKESMEFGIKISKDEGNRKIFKFFVNNYKKGEELLKNAKFVEFLFENDETIKYIKDNPVLKTKNIIVGEDFIYNNKLLEELKSVLDGNLNNVYFSISGNFDVIKYEDCLNTINTLNNIVKKVELYNFSPIEKIMYVYDFVRNKVYNLEDDGENCAKSRDLTSVLFGDKIVCTGYSILFCKILRELGINIYMYDLKGENNNYGHHRNCIYIKDDKYGIDGVYFFDTTWDSKKNEDDNTFLYSYKFFAKTKDFFDDLDKRNHLKDDNIWNLDYDLGDKVVEKISKPFDLMEKIQYTQLVNKLCRMSNNKELLRRTFNYEEYIKTLDLDKLKQDIDNIVEYYYKEIPAETILKIIYNVRKYQYYENTELYDFSLNGFFCILLNSDFKFSTMTAEERLLLAIFGEFNKKEHHRKNIIKYNNENELEKNIERVKIAKILRKLYEKK